MFGFNVLFLLGIFKEYIGRKCKEVAKQRHSFSFFRVRKAERCMAVKGEVPIGVGMSRGAWIP